MNKVRKVLAWVILGALGVGIAAGAWVVAVQLMLAVWDPMGAWQLPRITHVTILQVSRDQDKKLTGEVLVQAGDRTPHYVFAKEEAAELEADDDVWVLHNYRIHGNRPGHFRLTPLRLLLEYPEPWMLLAGWGIWILRRWQRRAAKAALPLERKVWRDDFHQRSERFAPPRKPEGE